MAIIRMYRSLATQWCKSDVYTNTKMTNEGFLYPSEDSRCAPTFTCPILSVGFQLRTLPDVGGIIKLKLS